MLINAASSILISIILYIFFDNFFKKKRFIDVSNKRSSHSSIATRVGGLSVFGTVLLISLYYYSIGNEIYNYSILIPLSVLVLVGLYDDIYKIDFKLKFIFQVIVAKIIIDNGLIIDNLHGFLSFYEINRIFAQIFTILLVVFIINAFNFIDGVDGLAVSIFIFFLIAFEGFASNPTGFYNFNLLLISSLLPYYYFNLKINNKIFLGDSGSTFLGGIASIYVISIFQNDYIIIPKYDINKILFVISILPLPIIDLIRVVLLRIKHKKSPFIADRNHIHHLVLDKFGSHIKTTMVLLLASLIILVFMQGLFQTK